MSTLRRLDNGKATTVAADYNAGATSVTVASAASLSTTFPFWVTRWRSGLYDSPLLDPLAERMEVTSAAGNALTVVRGAVAQAGTIGDDISELLEADHINDLNTAVQAVETRLDTPQTASGTVWVKNLAIGEAETVLVDHRTAGVVGDQEIVAAKTFKVANIPLFTVPDGILVTMVAEPGGTGLTAGEAFAVQFTNVNYSTDYGYSSYDPDIYATWERTGIV